MIWKFVLILFLVVYPVWMFIKLSRYGKGIFRPNFERMKRKIDEWTGFNINGIFAYNRTGGKLIYYLLLFYIITVIIFTIYSLAK